MGSNIHFVEGTSREDVFRGCSTFQMESEIECTSHALPDEDGVVTNFGVCKPEF